MFQLQWAYVVALDLPGLGIRLGSQNPRARNAECLFVKGRNVPLQERRRPLVRAAEEKSEAVLRHGLASDLRGRASRPVGALLEDDASLDEVERRRKKGRGPAGNR